MRLIDADAMKDVLESHFNTPDVQNGHLLRQWMRVVTNSCITLLDKAPTIDAVEVVHGRWANNGISELMLCKCTVCGSPCSAYAFNYCPNCGAKMDGERREP